MKKTFIISIEAYAGHKPVPDDMLILYVRDAIRNWSGQFEPEHLLFRYFKSIKIKRFHPEKEDIRRGLLP